MKALPDKDNKDELLRELEIESILEETHRLADQEQMKNMADKYRAKPKMDDIFSNKSKKPRLQNESPLEVDKSSKKRNATNENVIMGDKTATTMKAQLIMEGSDEIKTPQEAQAEAEAEQKQKEAQAKHDAEEAKQEEESIVTLAPEYDEHTRFSRDVIDELEQFSDSGVNIESINTIDIDIDDPDEKASESAEDKPQNGDGKNDNNEKSENAGDSSDAPKPDEEKGRYETLFGDQAQPAAKQPKRIVSKVPIYRPENPKDNLNVKAGRFSEVVANEYEEYIRSKNPSVIAHVIRPEPKPDNSDENEKPEDKRSAQEKILSAVVGFFSKDDSDDNDTPQQKAKPVEDYTGEEDEKSIVFELNQNIKKLFMRSLLSGIIAVAAALLTVVTRFFPSAIIGAVPFAPAAYGVFNLLLIGSSIALNRVAMLSGLTPLIKFKGNSDTAIAIGGIAAAVQAISAFFCLGDMSGFNVNYYCAIVLLGFFANNLGKLFMVLRVKDNFRFVSAKGQKYAAKIYNNESIANKMLSGTASEKNIIAYQHKTDFASNFLKISYAPDPSEDLASKLAPITTIAAILIALIYGVIKISFTDAVNTFALITALAIPVSNLIAVNLPVRKLCKTLLEFGSMLAGYPSIKQFCDSTAVMLDATELFPADTIELEGIKTYDEFNVDESLLCGIAILKEAQNPIANAFDSVVAETNETLPEVESVLYEDEMGLVGWINGERILVGSRQLMEKYSVETPSIDYEERYSNDGRQVTYLSRAGRLVAMLVTKYHADPELKTELQRAESNGISFLVRTTDYNITDDLIASLYGLFYRSVKVLPTGLGNVLKEAQGAKEETSRSYLITHGKASSLARAVSGSVKIKHNISLAIVIQLIAVILGILVAATLALYANVGVMGSLEVLIYALFWAVAAIIAPAIQKP